MDSGNDQQLQDDTADSLPQKLWLYTNFHCNLQCSYCVAESTPAASPRSLDLATVQQLVDEAAALGFQRLYLTGGEPLILEEIYEMIGYAASHLPTTLLTNAMLLRGRRWQQLRALKKQVNGNLTVQVSLDGASPEVHDAYRGAGTWAQTVAGIDRLLNDDFHVCISTTETQVNSAQIEAIRAFCTDLGIAAEDHFVRPLARRGFATEGLEVGPHNLIPELTVTVDGVYWHPLISPRADDMLVTRQIFPLASAVACVRQQLNGTSGPAEDERSTFT